MTVSVAVILQRKGDEVATISPDATAEDAIASLAEHDVGALIVTRPGDDSIEGIVSERDLVRRLARAGSSCLPQRVSEVMTAEVVTCEPSTGVDELMSLMTERRIRHVPVVEEDRLAGIVSIGDVVKSRLDELEVQAEALEQYVVGAGG